MHRKTSSRAPFRNKCKTQTIQRRRGAAPIDVDNHTPLANDEESLTTHDMMQMIQTIRQLQTELTQTKLEHKQLRQNILEECTCPICLEPMSNAVMLSCSSGHVVCRSCEGQLFDTDARRSKKKSINSNRSSNNTKGSCPICRGGVSYCKSRRVSVLNNIVAKVAARENCDNGMATTQTCSTTCSEKVCDDYSYASVSSAGAVCSSVVASPPPSRCSYIGNHGTSNTAQELMSFVNEAERLVARRGRIASTRVGINMNMIVVDRKTRDDAIVVD